MPYPSKKFRQNPFTSLRVIRRTDKQTDRQTDRTKNITSFFGGGNNNSNNTRLTIEIQFMRVARKALGHPEVNHRQRWHVKSRITLLLLLL